MIFDLYQLYSYDTPGVKTGPCPGVTSWNNNNREGRIHFVGETDSGERSRAIMAFLFFFFVKATNYSIKTAKLLQNKDL